jgi:acyl CoA:acetate/3-ketoacid CoA transferase alpha subunit
MNKQIFYDEEGNEVEFNIKEKFKYNGNDYIAMEEINNDGLIYLLKIETDEDGNEYLRGIDDEELDKVKNAYEDLFVQDE